MNRIEIFKIRATFGRDCHIKEFLKEYRLNTKNSLRTRIEWFLHIPSVLALECNSNVVVIEGIFKSFYSDQNALQMPHDCNSTAVRLLPSIMPAVRCLECCMNAVLLECSRNGCWMQFKHPRIQTKCSWNT